MSDRATTSQLRQLNSFIKEMDRQPYYMAHEEVTSALSNMSNPPNYTQEQINAALTKYKMGPVNGPR